MGQKSFAKTVIKVYYAINVKMDIINWEYMYVGSAANHMKLF